MNRPELSETGARQAPIVIAQPRPGVLSRVVSSLIIVLLLAVLGTVLLVLFTLASLVNVPGQVAGGLGSRLSGAADTTGQAVGRVQQALQDATDPQHPPVGLTYDTEFASLQVTRIGEPLPGGQDYALTLANITRRPNAGSPDVAQYATVHAELRHPRETRLLGQLIRTDADPHDHAVYKGESFRIGQTVYRVNWVSDADHAMAITAYRSPDTISAPLKFDYR